MKWASVLVAVYAAVFTYQVIASPTRIEIAKELAEPSIRLWTLGIITDNEKTSLVPSEEGINEFSKIIDEASIEAEKKGYVNIVVGPYIKCQVIKGNKDEFLVPVKMKDGNVLYRIQIPHK